MLTPRHRRRHPLDTEYVRWSLLSTQGLNVADRRSNFLWNDDLEKYMLNTCACQLVCSISNPIDSASTPRLAWKNLRCLKRYRALTYDVVLPGVEIDRGGRQRSVVVGETVGLARAKFSALFCCGIVARLRLWLRRGRLRSLPVVENEAWCRRWGSNPHDHTVKGF